MASWRSLEGSTQFGSHRLDVGSEWRQRPLGELVRFVYSRPKGVWILCLAEAKQASAIEVDLCAMHLEATFGERSGSSASQLYTSDAR